MAEHDPLAAEFAALRTAVLVRPPGVRAAQARVRQRRHRTAIVLTSVIAFVVAAAGVAFASMKPPHPEAPAALHTPTPPASSEATLGPSQPAGPTVSGGHPPVVIPSGATASGPACHQYGAVLLDHPTPNTVTVRVDNQGLYPLCPGERVRVFVAVYSYDAQRVQHLYYSRTGFLDAAHNPLTLPYQVPDCQDMVYVMSGNQTIKQTIPAIDPYMDGPQVYGGPQWGPYNGVIWLADQYRCATPGPSGTG
jgi:hypothetical protein